MTECLCGRRDIGRSVSKSHTNAICICVSLASQLDEAATCGDDKCVGTVMGSQLLHDVFDVNLHSLLGYEEPVGDVAISISTGKMLEHLGLPFAQILLT